MDDLVGRADKALYHAKLNGKNQVAIFDHGATNTWHPVKGS